MKTLEDFDFAQSPHIPASRIRSLAEGGYASAIVWKLRSGLVRIVSTTALHIFSFCGGSITPQFGQISGVPLLLIFKERVAIARRWKYPNIGAIYRRGKMNQGVLSGALWNHYYYIREKQS
jgi:hypothetical protein